MDNKIAYIFAEKNLRPKKNFNLLVIAYENKELTQTPFDAARTLRKLVKEGYTIIDKELSSKRIYESSKYRQIMTKDKKILAKCDDKLELCGEYPGIKLKELKIINALKEKGLGEGALWVQDVSLFSPEDLELATAERGCAPVTTYNLSIPRNHNLIAGRSQFDRYADVLKYFDGVLQFRNSTKLEAKKCSGIGRPLNDHELKALESLVRKEIRSPLE